MNDLLRVFSIFSSIQGESTMQGRPCVFVRLAGCPLNCSYCDTRLAREHQGRSMTIDQAVSEVLEARIDLVEVTGGEPLAQPAVLRLLVALADAGLEVMLETSGAYPVEDLDPRVRVIIDLKTPGSGMHERMHLANFDILQPGLHELKIVVVSRDDFAWALDFIKGRGIDARLDILFSPAHGCVSARDLASWMMESGCKARLQLQLHRFIWPDAKEER